MIRVSFKFDDTEGIKGRDSASQIALSSIL